MSTRLLYHGFGIRGYRYKRTRQVGVGVIFAIERKAETCRRAACGATNVCGHGIDAVTTHLPDATLVFDRFHIVKLYNEKLSNLRRELHCQLADSMQNDALEGVRWLLMKRPMNLDASRREPERFEEALRLREPALQSDEPRFFPHG